MATRPNRASTHQSTAPGTRRPSAVHWADKRTGTQPWHSWYNPAPMSTQNGSAVPRPLAHQPAGYRTSHGGTGVNRATRSSNYGPIPPLPPKHVVDQWIQDHGHTGEFGNETGEGETSDGLHHGNTPSTISDDEEDRMQWLRQGHPQVAPGQSHAQDHRRSAPRAAGHPRQAESNMPTTQHARPSNRTSSTRHTLPPSHPHSAAHTAPSAGPHGTYANDLSIPSDATATVDPGSHWSSNLAWAGRLDEGAPWEDDMTAAPNYISTAEEQEGELQSRNDALTIENGRLGQQLRKEQSSLRQAAQHFKKRQKDSDMKLACAESRYARLEQINNGHIRVIESLRKQRDGLQQACSGYGQAYSAVSTYFTSQL